MVAAYKFNNNKKNLDKTLHGTRKISEAKHNMNESAHWIIS